MRGGSDSRSARVREHFRSNVVGYIAIFLFAVGGTATALQGRNTVDSGDIRNKQVKRADIGRNAVNGSRVARDSLGGADVKESTLGLVPLAGNAAAVGGAAAPEIVRTDPAWPERTRPFLTEARFDSGVGGETIDLGFVTFTGNGGIRMCSETSTPISINYVRDYGLTNTAVTLQPGACSNFGIGGSHVVHVAMEAGTDAMYLTLIDPDQDEVMHLWAFS